MATVEVRIADYEPIIATLAAASELADAVAAFLNADDDSARSMLAEELERFAVAVESAKDWR